MKVFGGVLDETLEFLSWDGSIYVMKIIDVDRHEYISIEDPASRVTFPLVWLGIFGGYTKNLLRDTTTLYDQRK